MSDVENKINEIIKGMAAELVLQDERACVAFSAASLMMIAGQLTTISLHLELIAKGAAPASGAVPH